MPEAFSFYYEFMDTNYKFKLLIDNVITCN